MSRSPTESVERAGREARVRAESVRGLLWSAESVQAATPLADLSTVVDLASLSTMASANADGRLIAVTFLSLEYATVGLNWIEAMRRIGWRNYLVITGDEQTTRALDAMAVPCVDARVPKELSNVPFLNPVGFGHKGLAMTTLKFPIVCALLRLGLSVIMSDIDAVWLKNPMLAIAKETADVAFQRVAYFPKAVVRYWGFAACSGFTFFRSCPGTIALLESCITEHRGVQDDQVAMNLALISGDTRWMQRGSTARSEDACTEGDVLSTFRLRARRAIRGRATKYGLDLVGLPHHQFWRHDWIDTDRSEMVICHPNTPKDDGEKMKRFDELGIRYV